MPEGTEIVAALDGVVRLVRGDSRTGGCDPALAKEANFVVLSHGGGLETQYLHFSSVGVTAGMRVRKGDRLGHSGKTGWACGAHLHFKVARAESASWNNPSVPAHLRGYDDAQEGTWVASAPCPTRPTFPKENRFLAPPVGRTRFSSMDKSFLLEQLGSRLRESVQETHKAASGARDEARTQAARAVNLAKGQTARSIAAREALEVLGSFKARPLQRGEAIGLGAVVEVEDGETGKTLFLAPVGAGEELTGPDGDGIFQVVTPQSPFGKAILGKRVGDVVEVTLGGEPTEWTISFAA
jgi:transcription elongation GreA/GreB family factor